MTVSVRLDQSSEFTTGKTKVMLQEAIEHPCLFSLNMTERPSEGNEFTSRSTPKRYLDFNTFSVEITNRDFSVSLNGNSVHNLMKELNVSGVSIGHSIGFWRSLGVDIAITDEIIAKAEELVEEGRMDEGSIALLKNAKYEQG